VELNHTSVGSGTPVLLIHGLGSSIADWYLQMDDFSADHEVICCDLRGHGDSAKVAGPYSMEMLTEDVSELISALGRGPMHVVGISLGGMIGLQLALDHPEQVRSLTVVNSAPEVTIRTFEQRRGLWLRMAILRILGMKRMGAFIAGKVFPEDDEIEFRERMAEAWAKNDKRAYTAATKALIGWSVLARLDEISIPTLVITGTEAYSPSLVTEPLLAEIAGVQIEVIEGARHAAPVQQPEEFNRILLDFFKRL